MPSSVGRPPFLYLLSPPDPPLGFAVAVHEPGPIPPYRATRGESSGPGRPARRARPATGLAGGQIRLSLEPGQKGTKRLLAKYGDRLVCVRYRYDPARRKGFTTVEIVVDERDWLPPPRRADDQVVGVHVAFEEVDLRRQVKQAGGRWNPQRRVWQLPYGEAVALGLRDRVVTEQASTRRCPVSSGKHLHADAAEASR